MIKKKKLKSNIVLFTCLLSFNVSCTTFTAYQQEQPQGTDEYVYKQRQEDRDAYEQERRRSREEHEKNRQQDRAAYEQERKVTKSEDEQKQVPDRTVYENEYEEVGAEVQEDMFPLSRKLLRGNRGRPIDRSSFMITFSTILPFSFFTDAVTSSSKVSSGSHTHKRRMRRHAASWNNPDSMIAQSSTVDE